jgi:hypothetical protein
LLEWRTTFPELLFKAKDLLSEQMCGQLLGERFSPPSLTQTITTK